MRRFVVLFFGLLLLVTPVAAATYLLMPLPGSQLSDSLEIAYLARQAHLPIGVVGAALSLFAVVMIVRQGRSAWRYVGLIASLAPVIALLVGAQRMSAERLFLAPTRVAFASGATEAIPAEAHVIGVVNDGVPVAYPLRLLAYHHLIADHQHGTPLLPTY